MIQHGLRSMIFFSNLSLLLFHDRNHFSCPLHSVRNY